MASRVTKRHLCDVWRSSGAGYIQGAQIFKAVDVAGQSVVAVSRERQHQKSWPTRFVLEHRLLGSWGAPSLQGSRGAGVLPATDQWPPRWDPTRTTLLQR